MHASPFVPHFDYQFSFPFAATFSGYGTQQGEALLRGSTLHALAVALNEGLTSENKGPTGKITKLPLGELHEESADGWLRQIEHTGYDLGEFEICFAIVVRSFGYVRIDLYVPDLAGGGKDGKFTIARISTWDDWITFLKSGTFSVNPPNQRAYVHTPPEHWASLDLPGDDD